MRASGIKGGSYRPMKASNMTTLLRLPGVAFALLLFLAQANASSGGGAFVSIHDLSLKDLDQDDGVAPALSLTSGSSDVYVSVSATSPPFSLLKQVQQANLEEIVLSIYPADGLSSAFSTVGAGLNGSPGNQIHTYAEGIVEASATRVVSFRLSPYTEFRISGALHVYGGSQGLAPGGEQSATSLAQISLFSETGASFVTSLNRYVNPLPSGERNSYDEEREYSFAFSSGASPAAVSIYQVASVTAINVTGVPEPSTLALLCAGLLLGFIKPLAAKRVALRASRIAYPMFVRRMLSSRWGRGL